MDNTTTYINLSRCITVTGEDIDDIMSSALDWIHYWCSDAEVQGEYLGEYASEQISRGGTIAMHLRTGNTEILSNEKFLKGLTKYLSRPLYECVVPAGAQRKYSLDCGMIDGPAADMIMQYALFGEIIY